MIERLEDPTEYSPSYIAFCQSMGVEPIPYDLYPPAYLALCRSMGIEPSPYAVKPDPKHPSTYCQDVPDPCSCFLDGGR